MSKTIEKRDSRGGRFEIKDGKRVRIDNGTQDHKDGNRARTKDGLLIGTNGQPQKSDVVPANVPANNQKNK